MKIFAGAGALPACFLALLAAPAAKQPYSNWSDYGGAADSMQYSALKQIDKNNVKQLDLAWKYLVPDRRGNFGFNPVIVDGVMYVLGQNNSIVALDAATGKQLWSHPFEQNIVSQRGINYWQGKNGADRRLILGVGSSLTELNARTGVTVNTFGNDGLVNMRVGEPRPLGGPSATPGRVFENVLIVGSQTGEGYGSAPGDVRGYDVETGKEIWDFHTIPRPGEFGYDTWPKDAWKYVGGVNTWGEISIDEKRGIAYFPLGSPTHDMFGGDRKGTGLFGDCLLALDARTGKYLWHFQVVHHDLWDYDPTAAPKLLTVKHDGKMVDVVALPTKFGLLYVFNRVTGKPLWPIEERPVPKSDVPGEESWPTQPFPTAPPPFARLKFTVDEINPYLDDAERAHMKELFLAARNEGIFTPPTLDRYQISIPGELGGANWGGSAADPTTGMLYVRAADQPGYHILREAGARGGARGGGGGGRGGGNAMQRGRAAFTTLCEGCHGPATADGIHSMDKATMIAVKALGADRIKKTVRGGQGQMPPFDDETLSADNLDALIAYLNNPAAAGRGGGAGGGRSTPLPDDGIKRYTGPLGTMFRASNGLLGINPPWAQIVAYDLNQGTIKWRATLGNVPALAAKGITGTGNNQRIHRNGPAVTAGGLIFVGSWGDRTVHAYDKDTGKILWEKELEANPEGLAAVYEDGGREYVAFCASGSVRPGEAGDTKSIAAELGKADAQGYYVFALPAKSSAKK